MVQRRAGSRRGVALVSAIVFLAITVVFVATALLVSTSNYRLASDSFRTYQAQLAAEAGLQRVIAESWFAYETTEEVPTDYQVTLETFRIQLDEVDILAGEQETTGYAFGDAVLYQEAWEDSGYRASVRRVDVGDKYTLLRVDAAGFVGSAASPVATRRMSADIRIQVPQADSQGFAVLGNNANCLFCHTQISSLEAAYKKEDGSLINLFALTTPQDRERALKDKERVKMAMLENLLTDRSTEMQSLITGTTYTRGTTNVVASNGSLRAVPLQMIDKQSTSRLSSEEAKTLTELEAVDCSTLCEKRHALFYKNYPLRNAADGDVPQVFPQLLEDANGNRQIEHSEWQDAVAHDDTLGNLKGGDKAILTTRATGERDFEQTHTELQAVATLASSESIDGVQGNVVLEGTSVNPLVIEGTLYINGDVVVRGIVTGDGKIIARGNVYITGDITYACDDDSQDFNWYASQRQICNYGKPDTLPRLGIMAGKNILVGSYMTPATSKEGKPADQLTRTDFSQTSPDDFARWFVDVGVSLETPQFLSYAMVQMTLFNENEYRKAASDSSYTPRFYTLRDGGAVFRCSQGFSSVKEDYCKTYAEVTVVSDQTILERATILSATPNNAWLGQDKLSSELALRKKWIESVEGSRTPNALHLDGLYYTPNGLFGNLPTRSNTQGKLLLNGSLAAADIALLAPAGLAINNDERLAEMLELNQSEYVMQTISNYRLLNTTETINYSPIKE